MPKIPRTLFIFKNVTQKKKKKCNSEFARNTCQVYFYLAFNPLCLNGDRSFEIFFSLDIYEQILEKLLFPPSLLSGHSSFDGEIHLVL